MIALSSQASVTDWPLRLLLTAATAAVIVLVLAGLRRGWRRRAQRQDWAPLPVVPPLTGRAAGPFTGKYIGTVRAGDWLDRIVAGGAMARADVTVAPQGVLVDRQGEEQLFLPAADITDVGTAPGMLTKVFGRHGILTVSWRWGGAEVVSGIWFADPADSTAVRSRIATLLPEATGAGGGGDQQHKEGSP